PRGTKLEIRREGTRLTGPSVNDNCRGVAVMLALAESIDEQHVRALRPIEFVATTGEEGAGNLRGAKHYFASRGRSAASMIALDYTVESVGTRPCGETEAEHPLVLAALEATRLVGREPDLATASTDANVPISQGIPAIAIGAGGRGGDAHSPSEWFDNSDGTI